MAALLGGAQKFWIAGPETATVTVFTATSGMRVYGSGEAVPTIFGESLSIDALFAGLNP